MATSENTRIGIPIDVDLTERISTAFTRSTDSFMKVIADGQLSPTEYDTLVTFIQYHFQIDPKNGSLTFDPNNSLRLDDGHGGGGIVYGIESFAIKDFHNSHRASGYSTHMRKILSCADKLRESNPEFKGRVPRHLAVILNNDPDDYSNLLTKINWNSFIRRLHGEDTMEDKPPKDYLIMELVKNSKSMSYLQQDTGIKEEDRRRIRSLLTDNISLLKTEARKMYGIRLGDSTWKNVLVKYPLPFLDDGTIDLNKIEFYFIDQWELDVKKA